MQEAVAGKIPPAAGQAALGAYWNLLDAVTDEIGAPGSVARQVLEANELAGRGAG
ncbi:MAG TPA: hypothetical protein VHB47_26035 [Thermoanaerobaculia bacterium]|jgi:hypothetical protein|nr:hypothetical protein [Thermoanaerobaculia bacterium]